MSVSTYCNTANNDSHTFGKVYTNDTGLNGMKFFTGAEFLRNHSIIHPSTKLCLRVVPELLLIDSLRRFVPVDLIRHGKAPESYPLKK
jgi:hypothetical protein